MLIPVSGPHGHQEFIQYDKTAENNIQKTKLFGVIYVPLTSADQQLGK